MQKQSITFQKYTMDDRDKIAVYSKLRARHAATGLDYFAKLRNSTTLAINGIADGIGEDMLHAAAVGRLEAEAYMRDVAHNMPLSLAAFEVLLEDFGKYQKLEQRFQYSEVQTVIDNDMTSGGTGRTDYTHRRKITEAAAAEAVQSITTDMVKTGEALEAVMLSILKKKSLVKIFLLYADGVQIADIADIIGDSVRSVEHHIYRAKAKLKEAGLEAYLK